MKKTRKIEEAHYFANRLDTRNRIEQWTNDSQIQRIWFTDRVWMKDDPERYEVILMWEEKE